MTQNQESPAQYAERKATEEESVRLESRKAQIEREESARREQVEQDRQREEARAKAATKAEELGRRRVALEEQAQETMAGLKEILNELRNVDSEHRTAVRESGKNLGASQYQTISQAIQEWTKDALLRDTPRPRTLQAIDLLAVTPDDEAPRAPAPGLPGANVQDAPRQNATAFLHKLEQRATMLRRDYGRDLAFGELVQPDERDAYYALSLEDRQRVQAMLTGSE